MVKLITKRVMPFGRSFETFIFSFIFSIVGITLISLGKKIENEKAKDCMKDVKPKSLIIPGGIFLTVGLLFVIINRILQISKDDLTLVPQERIYIRWASALLIFFVAIPILATSRDQKVHEIGGREIGFPNMASHIATGVVVALIGLGLVLFSFLAKSY